MAQNWIGIRASAIITILGSAGTLLMAGIMMLAAFLPQPAAATPSPIPMKPLGIVMSVFFLALAAWGGSTGIGIILRRRWSRISIIIFAAILAVIAGGGMLIIFAIPLPTPPGADPAIIAGVRYAIAGFYGLLTIISIWWLVLFNRSITKSYFHGLDPAGESVRPLSISIVAWYLLSAVVFYVPVLLFRSPAVVFGVVFTGWIALVIIAVFSAAQIYIGAGLLRLRESARVAAMVYFCIVGANALASLRPATQAEMMRQMQISMPKFFPTAATGAVSPFPWPFGLVMIVLTALPIFFLVRRRGAFQPIR
ncbi:MAG: hypothetical protein ABI693_12755 [Bryobacteraceae bacterium]